MNNVTDDVLFRMDDAFPDYPVRITQDRDDTRVYFIRVYGVAQEDVEAVEDVILDVQDEYLPVAGCVLIPMVKDINTTNRYYPQEAEAAELRRSLGGVLDLIGNEETTSSYIGEEYAAIANDDQQAVEPEFLLAA